jgi:CDP-diacylglycerol pyrophosphatase
MVMAMLVAVPLVAMRWLPALTEQSWADQAPATPKATGHDPDALWKLVQTCRKSDPRQDRRNPCDVVKPAADYALLKDICGPTQYLLLPLRHLSGIESPDLATAPNYFPDAWDSRSWVAARAGRAVAPEDIVLALNSTNTRSQNQLHIHIDLARPGLADALRNHAGDPIGGWAFFRFEGREYYLMPLSDLTTQNPVALVRARLVSADGPTAAPGEMHRQGIAITGATFADGSSGFYLLNSEFDGTSNGNGWTESLEIDHPAHDCAYRRVPGQ